MSDTEPHILVVDDDTRLRALLQRYLSEQGFRVTTAESAGEARRKLEALTFDLLVLDIMMPGESGLDLTQALRLDSRVPILLLTAMTETEDRIEGLTRGADDYLSKPFEPRELVLRINAILRRVPQAPAPPRELNFGEFTFDLARSELKRRGAVIRLTEVETALLAALARQPGEVLSREDLRQETAEATSTRSVDVQMTRLRRKIEDDPKYPRFLRTVRGSGYVLMSD
ncbi:response regulator [Rhodovibrio salinarum]|uniref:DNA-binding response regulator n=1 Tax=Rhodovibrio salinarum TaxID=1087 RepID=A0A934V1Q3_9PROT|nr:response regulator [Rhodovibrio salinarum]MBK1698923.1 DNA-binding response regulator [Rhodovibrio salinarum]